MKIILTKLPNFRLILPLLLLLAVAVVALGQGKNDEPNTTAGLAKTDITPRVPVRMVGYASRAYEGEPAEDKLFARALAIGDAEGELGALMITADLLGIPKSLARLP